MGNNSKLFCQVCMSNDIETFYKKGKIIRHCKECNRRWIGEKVKRVRISRRHRADPLIVHECKMLIARINHIINCPLEFKTKWNMIKNLDETFLNLVHPRTRNNYFPLNKYEEVMNNEEYHTYFKNRCNKMIKDLALIEG